MSTMSTTSSFPPKTDIDFFNIERNQIFNGVETFIISYCIKKWKLQILFAVHIMIHGGYLKKSIQNPYTVMSGNKINHDY